MVKLTTLPAWQALVAHQREISKLHLRDLFATDDQRFSTFSIEAGNLFLDYSKNRITTKTLDLLCDLAVESNMPAMIEALFTGVSVNTTENRPALHTALRNSQGIAAPICEDVQTVLDQMSIFTTQIREGHWRGYTDKPITDVINVGIGGSDLGPALAVEALAPYVTPTLQFHFISNVDSSHLSQTLQKLNPETSLFIISSKSFTTEETLINARSIQQWFRQNTTAADEARHFAAVTSNPAKALAFGIAPANIFRIWDWVGGRYSLWSAVGLPIALAIGMDNFQEFLAGAATLDQHFQTAPLNQNMPVLMGLLSIWYNNFFDAPAQAILPYEHALRRLPAYLQQAEMESNGKNTTHDGSLTNYQTCPIIFGEPGTNAQHTFYQLLHQGTRLIPVDFVVPLQTHYPLANHSAILFTHALSQSKALMQGKNATEVEHEMRAEGFNEADINRLTPHKVLAGNQPSNTLVFEKLTPGNLGSLLALYEHKIFVQSIIWQINPFDQWGVEHGKQLAQSILPNVLNPHQLPTHDGSTNGLIVRYHQAANTK